MTPLEPTEIDLVAARDRMDARLAPLYAQDGSPAEAVAATCAASGIKAAELMQRLGDMSGATAEALYTGGGISADELERLGVDPQLTIQILNGYLLKTFWWGYEAGRAAGSDVPNAQSTTAAPDLELVEDGVSTLLTLTTDREVS